MTEPSREEVFEGIKSRHKHVEDGATSDEKLKRAADMAYLSHLDCADLLARLSEVEKALEDAGNFIKDWDNGNPETEHGWFYDEFLEQWLKIQAAIQHKDQQG